ncbi:MAG TPA: SDR family NAD(P)-dependent oxidoreductase, partial [Rheinheimera sp.]
MSRNTALITGASSGIGAVYADRLARRGYDLVLVARNTDRLKQVAQRISQEHDVNIQIVPADLATPAGSAIVEDILKTGQVSFLVNNAGFGAVSTLLQTNIDDMVNMID